jgi:rhamnulose-1-phosphate aldolase
MRQINNSLENTFLNSPKIRTVLAEMAEVAQYLWTRGWAEKNAGNMSVNITELVDGKSMTGMSDSPFIRFQIPYYHLKGNTFILTGTGTRMRDLARKPEANICFIRISETGIGYQQYCTALADPDLRPTSELPSHMAVHDMFTETKRDFKVLLHTHATEIIALTQNPLFRSKESLNRILLGMHPENVLFIPQGVGYLPFTSPGTEKIAQATMKEFGNHQALIWEKHGVLSTGRNVLEAFDTIDLLVKAAKIWFFCRNAGFEPEGLSDAQIDEIRKQLQSP